MRKSTTFRIRVITACILGIGLILIVRLYQIQVHDTTLYREKAERQYVHTAKDVYNRGSIFFTTKDGETVSAASITSGFILSVNPTLITDATAVYEKLTPYLTISKEVFLERAQLPNRTYVEIEPKLTQIVADSVEALDIDGVMLYRNQWRYYPGGPVSARTIGFVGYMGGVAGQLHGKYGLERISVSS